MGFLLNKDGERVNVNVDADWFDQDIVLYADDAGLRDLYILNLYQGRHGVKGGSGNKEPELIQQIEYWDAPPTKDQIMFQMHKHGLSRYDIATIEQGFMLDWK